MKNNMLKIIIYMMKTKCSLLIYNKAIGYAGFKCYTYLIYKLIYIECNLIEQ